mmetsp:Transcript_1520/g.5979  ORF Transcript_1520/g.5979 Transcript_1520/m.5979 type:complete len:260 (-) Transcript_1520:151-930(-)
MISSTSDLRRLSPTCLALSRLSFSTSRLGFSLETATRCDVPATGQLITFSPTPPRPSDLPFLRMYSSIAARSYTYPFSSATGSSMSSSFFPDIGHFSLGNEIPSRRTPPAPAWVMMRSSSSSSPRFALARCAFTASSKSLRMPSVFLPIIASLDLVPSSTALAMSRTSSALASYVFPRSFSASTRASCVCDALIASSSFLRMFAELLPACSRTSPTSFRDSKTSRYSAIRASVFSTALVLGLSVLEFFGIRRLPWASRT